MLIWLIYIFLEAYIQYRLIKGGTKPLYIQLFIIRGMISIFHGILLDVNDIHEYLPILGFQICSFWVIFDPLLNWFRGKKWNYKGEDSGWLDKLPYTYYYIFKIIALIGAFASYSIGLQYWIF